MSSKTSQQPPLSFKEKLQQYERLRAWLAKRQNKTSQLTQQFNTVKKDVLRHLVEENRSAKQPAMLKMKNCGYSLEACVKENKGRISENMLMRSVKEYSKKAPQDNAALARFMTFLESKRKIKRSTYLSRRKLAPEKKKKKKASSKRSKPGDKQNSGSEAHHLDWHAIIFGRKGKGGGPTVQQRHQSGKGYSDTAAVVQQKKRSTSSSSSQHHHHQQQRHSGTQMVLDDEPLGHDGGGGGRPSGSNRMSTQRSF